jgi:hypothetical protein
MSLAPAAPRTRMLSVCVVGPVPLIALSKIDRPVESIHLALGECPAEQLADGIEDALAVHTVTS